MLRVFVRHPASVGETYGEHFVTAGTYGVRMLLGAFACLAHALLPFLFEHTGSRCIAQLHGRMSARRAADLTGGASAVTPLP